MNLFTAIIKYFIIILFIISSSFAQLKNENNQADYIIITVSQFDSTLQNFVKWRSKNNLKIKIANKEDIYSEFPESSGQQSIRDFVSYALTYWQNPKPKYVLLAGGTKFIPSYKVPSSFATYQPDSEDSVSLDQWYVINKYEPGTLPDAAIGRFPVNTETELKNIIAKTIFVEDSLSENSYSKDFLILTDKKDSSLFHSLANDFISSAIPQNYSVDSIFTGYNLDLINSRKHLLEGMNNGCMFFNYFGHGAPEKWSFYNLFTYENVPLLEKNKMPFIFSAAACSQNFDIQGDSCLVKKLLVYPKGGAVASFASSGLNLAYLASVTVKKFFNTIFKNPGITIGEAVLDTWKSLNYSYTTNDATIRRYTLLGDPALKIPFRAIAAVKNIPASFPDKFVLEQNYPNPFNPSTKIQYNIPERCFVSIKVFDVLGREVKTLVNDFKNPGTYSVEFLYNNLSSGVYFYRMETNSGDGVTKFVSMKKMVFLK